MTPEQVQVIVSKAIEQSGSYGGPLWIASIVVIGGGILAVLHFLYILVPQSKSRQLNDAKIADTLVLLGATSADTNSKVTRLSNLSDVILHMADQVTATNSRTRRLLNAKVALAKVAQKIAMRTDTDISLEIGEIRGALADINQAGVEDDEQDAHVAEFVRRYHEKRKGEGETA